MATRQAKADPQTEALLKRLDDLVERWPDLAEPAAFYRAALPALRAAQKNIEPFTLDAEAAKRKLESGLPLLVGEDLPLDVEATRDLFLRLCRIVENTAPEEAKASRPGWGLRLAKRGQPDSLKLIEQARNGNGAALRAAAAGQIRRAVEGKGGTSGRPLLDLSTIWAALALGDWRRLELIATSLKLDAELLRLLAQNSLKPAMRVWAQGLKNVDLDDWRRGQCPLCGSPPLLTEIQGKEGERRLRCGVCGASWHYPRLQCVLCNNQNYKQLGYITVEGEEEKYSLQTCDACRGYLKVVVTYDPIPVAQLPVEDLATLHLDLIAAEREYTRAPAR
ncbi:MAG: formate dehydrogenase accessory protein FdhE [Chloroflexi bacterium]|nr:formate dehydrogenase accessory protein FdhE [Chloroflexota bacterium]